ncbi:cell wall-binding repeat-containing protein [Peptostreptococcus stomatis]|uniref:cell wall-binding repeat-containing protein n=1 Tax=Peptostreptococcus stomatis TaxID=341694 RepID=UPI003994F05D
MKFKKLTSMVLCASMLAVMGQGFVSFAKEQDDILSHNKDLFKEYKDSVKEGYDIKNNWLKLKLVPYSEHNLIAVGLIHELKNFQFGPDTPEPAKPVGFLLPEGINAKKELFEHIYDDYIFGSLGVTGSEIEKFRRVAEQSGKSELYKKVKYPESDMSAKGETNKVCKLTADELKDKTIDIKSDLSTLKAWEEFTYDEDTINREGTFYTKIYLALELPDGLSYTKSDGRYDFLHDPEAIKELVDVKNPDYQTRIVDIKGKKATIELVYRVERVNLEGFKNKANLNIDLSVGGIKFDNTKSLGKKYTIKGSIYGYLSNGDHDPILAKLPIHMAKRTVNKSYIRDVNAFSTMQEKAGKDEASDLDKIMSITVAVKSCTVTFINGSSQSEVLVEPGKSINGDIDDSQSMPSDPTRLGYTFKGWFTQPDGKGDKFTGDTVVNSDMTVYAYFKKDPSNPYNPGKPDPGRVDGDDRIETGVKISQKYYDKAKTVIVVRHDLFPDSMTASVLAKLKDAPILLNPTNKLDPRVGAEIKRLGAEEVIIVGGPDSISEKVRGDLKAYDKDKDVERIAGVDRYGTSEMVARRVTGITGKKNTGVIASGQVFPDALSVGTFASRDGYPILLVKKNLVPDQVVRAIKDLDIKKTYIAGGTNTISKSTEAKLPGVLERMAGKDRYETSVAIAKSKFKDSREAFIASGEEFADALVISPVSGKYNRPTLLASRNKKTNAVVKKYIEESYLTSITAIGGEKYLPKSVILDLVGK